MSIMVKGVNGQDVEVASKGVSQAGLTTGIIGTSLAALLALGNGGGLLNGLTGGINPNTASLVAEGAQCCFVNKDMFYNTLIGQINTQADRDISTERRFAGIEAAIAVNATSNSYQNAAVNQRFESENTINNLNRNLAICEATKNVIRGDVYLSPTHLADNYIAPTRVLDSHEAREYLHGRRFDGGCAPCGGRF